MLLESKVLLSSNIFHTNFLILLKLHTVIKFHLLMMGASNLAILIFLTCFFHFWHFIAHNFMKKAYTDVSKFVNKDCPHPTSNAKTGAQITVLNFTKNPKILPSSKRAFTRQSKNGTDPTKTGTVPTVFAKKQ